MKCVTKRAEPGSDSSRQCKMAAGMRSCCGFLKFVRTPALSKRPGTVLSPRSFHLYRPRTLQVCVVLGILGTLTQRIVKLWLGFVYFFNFKNIFVQKLSPSVTTILQWTQGATEWAASEPRFTTFSFHCLIWNTLYNWRACGTKTATDVAPVKKPHTSLPLSPDLI